MLGHGYNKSIASFCNVDAQAPTINGGGGDTIVSPVEPAIVGTTVSKPTAAISPIVSSTVARPITTQPTPELSTVSDELVTEQPTITLGDINIVTKPLVLDNRLPSVLPQEIETPTIAPTGSFGGGGGASYSAEGEEVITEEKPKYWIYGLVAVGLYVGYRFIKKQ